VSEIAYYAAAGWSREFSGCASIIHTPGTVTDPDDNQQVKEGTIDVDQSALTGESLPVTLRGGDAAQMGATVVRGETHAVGTPLSGALAAAMMSMHMAELWHLASPEHGLIYVSFGVMLRHQQKSNEGVSNS